MNCDNAVLHCLNPTASFCHFWQSTVIKVIDPQPKISSLVLKVRLTVQLIGVRKVDKLVWLLDEDFFVAAHDFNVIEGDEGRGFTVARINRCNFVA